MEETNERPLQVMHNVLAGIVFVMMSGFNISLYFMPPSRIFGGVICIVIAVLLFAGQKKIILSIGFLCMAFVEVVNIALQHLMFETYSIELTEDIKTFNVILTGPDVMMVIAYLVAAFITYKMISEYAEYSKKGILCFLPGMFCLGALIYYTVMYVVLEYVLYEWWNISAYRLTGYVLSGIAFIFVMLWLRQPGEPVEKDAMTFEKQVSQRKQHDYESLPGYINLSKHIILILFTFGIWLLIWIYKTTYYLTGLEYGSGEVKVNGVSVNEKKSSDSARTQLLLCIFIPYYFIFWMCSRAKTVERKALDAGIPVKGFFTICVIFSILLPFIPPILMQDKINEIVIKQNDR
ncbi:MAG: DUF4234 domain-containing protein [Lachnospiraceae bacterium]|nr:DUF4234 domain-containing protein [Lachnospiraceae bacterium]